MMVSLAQSRLQVPAIRGLLIDISGTLLIGSSAIPGAAQALAKLRAAHIPFRLCSNTSKESTDVIHKRMQAAGLDVHRAEVWTSIGALKAVLKQLEVKRPYMLLSPSALEECTDRVPEADNVDASAIPESVSESSSLPYDAVVVGLAPALLDYAHLNSAFRILVGEDRPRDHAPTPSSQAHHSGDVISSGPIPLPHRAPLIALHKARYIEASDHALSLGLGPFVLALEDAVRTSATVVGKPTRAFFETVLQDLERDFDVPASPQPPHRWEGIAVIGDDVHADLGEGAIELGLWRVLVQTGKYRSGDEGRSNESPPDQVCGSFAEFVEVLLEQWQTS